MKYEKLSKDNSDKTTIMCGQTKMTIEQLEHEMENPKSEVGRKLRSVEDILEKNY